MKHALLLFILPAITLASCESMQAPVFNGIENVQLNKIEKGKPKLTLYLSFFNPNKRKANLKKADGEAWMDSAYLGHFVVDEGIEIPANASFLVPVKLDMETRQLVQHSLSMLLADEVLISIKGSARVGRGGISRTIPLNYQGKQSLHDLVR